MVVFLQCNDRLTKAVDIDKFRLSIRGRNFRQETQVGEPKRVASNRPIGDVIEHHRAFRRLGSGIDIAIVQVLIALVL